MIDLNDSAQRMHLRDEVLNLLTKLGTSYLQVTESLSNKGIDVETDKCCQESRHVASNCPVHDYIKQQMPELGTCEIEIFVNRGKVSLYHWGGEEPAKLPDFLEINMTPPVMEFVDRFDQHALDT